tara:strand:+ start:979 stop:1116 length:138 start_codon:yes stop_codon:yes gene_type:complete
LQKQSGCCAATRECIRVNSQAAFAATREFIRANSQAAVQQHANLS